MAARECVASSYRKLIAISAMKKISTNMSTKKYVDPVCPGHQEDPLSQHRFYLQTFYV
jgi:hypothetical protein